MSQDTLQIKKSAAIQTYAEAPDEFKPVLETLLGKENLIPADIKDRVKTFEDACRLLGIGIPQAFKLSGTTGINRHLDAAEAFIKLRIIAEALNEGWEPDWSDSDQIKCYPWFENDGSGFRFGDGINYSGTSVGSRLCFKNSDLAEYAGAQFIDLYKQMFAL